MDNPLLEQRIAVEEFLNGHSYRGAPLGSLCAHTLNRLVIRNLGVSAGRILGDWAWLLSRLFTWRRPLKAAILMLQPNLTQRGTAQFTPVERLMQPGEAAFQLISDVYRGAAFGTFAGWLIRSVIALPGYFRLLSHCNRVSGCFPFRRRMSLLQVILLQTLRYDFALHRLRYSPVKKIVVDLDRGYFQAPVVLAANQLGRESITLVHGIIFPPYLYVPVIARRVFCWGHFHEQFFRRYSAPSVQYSITGNPAFRDKQKQEASPDCPAVSLRKKHPGQRVVTCVSQNFSDQAQYNMISAFCRSVTGAGGAWLGVVKAHPADKAEHLEQLLQPFPQVVLLGREAPLEQVIGITDLFLVVNSNVAFDAVLAGKPVCFWHIDDERNGLACLFTKEAAAVQVKDEAGLTSLLRRCASTDIGCEINIRQQSEFAGQFCAYTGGSAAQITRKILIST